MNLINAKNCLFQVKFGDDFVTVMCAKRVSVDRTVTTKEITDTSDGQYRSFDYKDKSHTVDLDMVTLIQDDVNPVLFDFGEWQDNFLEIEYRIIYKNSINQFKVFRGTGIIETVSDTIEAGQLAQGTIHIQGSGKYYFEDVIPEYINLTMVMTGNDDDINARFRFKLTDINGDTILDSALLPEADANYINNPANLVKPVLKGLYYFYWQVISETENNTWSLTATPTASGTFDTGTQSVNDHGGTLRDFNADRSITFTLGGAVPPPTCVPPSLPTHSMPDGQTGVAYTDIISVTGTSPMSLSNITKPSWMNLYINVVGGSTQVIMAGTPDAEGTGITVSFDITNACGTDSYSDAIDITAGPEMIPIVYFLTQNAGIASLRIYVNGIQQVFATGTTSGIIHCLVGDAVQATLTKAPFITQAHLIVDSDVDGNLYDQDGLGLATFEWTALTGREYTVDGETHS